MREWRALVERRCLYGVVGAAISRPRNVPSHPLARELSPRRALIERRFLCGIVGAAISRPVNAPLTRLRGSSPQGEPFDKGTV